MRRRRFLQALVALLASKWPPAAAALSGAPADPVALPDPDERARRLLAQLRLGPAAPALGREYLELCPHEAEIDTLLRAVGAEPGAGFQPHVRALESVEEIAGRLRQAEADDFAAQRVVELSGWVLSRSEARLCALAALV
jgi:hypothetical protein